MTKEELHTEEKIFRAATEIFEEKGMSGARMQDIADRAGINKALLHYYFRSKEKLFEAVFEMLTEKMFEKFAAILAQQMPFKEKIEYFFREHIGFLQKNPMLPLFIMGEVERKPELLQRFLSKLDFNRIKGSLKESLPVDMADKEVAHLMITILSLSIFPVVARPIIAGVLKMPVEKYDDFLEERKTYSPYFIMKALENSLTDYTTDNRDK